MLIIFRRLHPKNIFIVLDKIDEEEPSFNLSRNESNRRVFWTLACVCLCLLMIHYLKYFSTFKTALSYLSSFLSEDKYFLQQKLQSYDVLRLASYIWWTLWHVIGYLVIPFVFIRFIMKTSFINMGWRFEDTKKHTTSYLLLLSPILFFIFIASFGKDFIDHYPFYTLAGRSWFDLITWEILYLTQFICLEFFFRGFMLNALRPAIGANAVWVMCVPYMMIHLPKLWPEAFGAIMFGLFLGILAIRSRSIWGGFFVHAGIAISMDATSLIKQGAIPNLILPW